MYSKQALVCSPARSQDALQSHTMTFSFASLHSNCLFLVEPNPSKSGCRTGLEHPKFRGRKGQLAMYLTCWKDIFSPENFSRIAPPRAAPKGIFHKLLATQISHLLRLRIIQEATVVGRKAFASLTRAEFKELRETGEIPHRDAVAVVVAPPVNRDRITKNKPAASIEPEVPSDDQLAPSASDFHREAWCPTAQVPLYNGLTMFPSAPQRAMLHKALCKVLNAERRSRLGQSSTSSDDNRRKESTPGLRKKEAMHSFSFRMSALLNAADSAALAIALWRLRMWEGDAYQGLVCSGGWEVDGEWRMNYLQEKPVIKRIVMKGYISSLYYAFLLDGHEYRRAALRGLPRTWGVGRLARVSFYTIFGGDTHTYDAFGRAVSFYGKGECRQECSIAVIIDDQSIGVGRRVVLEDGLHWHMGQRYGFYES
ncbi:hypothetical protein F5J12DRAFT_781620 [Pisolithus orientalis]|uniref:uncharacterized protein n=1 Tax=Pisolithus orientalis TaxID=936130 RepID=UPI002224A362|nr:uncharacterized protein F5J12DRAFT_781620 [Pisolithus orientalis]KAI6012753.1 hypothetical protein F5J12DRAFT_781620 [Pisolithus orientalis]